MGSSGNAQEAFRRHRHDVMNGLQLVKAYMQLNRPGDAMEALNRLADWLSSLSAIQASITGLQACVLWAAAECPHVWLTSLLGSPPSDVAAEELSDCLRWLDEQANAQGIRVMRVQLQTGQTRAEDPISDGLVVHVEKTKETTAWWHNTGNHGTDLHSWEHVELRLADASQV